MINSVFKTIALWLLFYWVGRRILIRPLKQLLESINRVDMDKLDTFEIDLKSSGNNEFNIIESAFGDMVSNLRNTQMQLLDIQQHLEHKVEQRTDELSKATQQANLANQAKSQFMSRVSHELNTPLNAILCSAQLMTEKVHDEDDEAHSFIHNILTAARHLHLLIQDIMDIVHNENDNLNIELEPCELAPLVQDCVELIRQAAFEKSIHITYQAEPAVVMGNVDRIKQVILNILDNAIKFNTPHGAIGIKINAGSQDKVELTISDTGIGIAPEDFDKIFDPMSRLASAEQKCIDGMGLGLSIVKLLLTKMNATIKVESDGHAGTKFIIHFSSIHRDLP